jgi:hypothetical protein
MAVTFDAATPGSAVSDTTLTISHTVGAGSNRVLYVGPCSTAGTPAAISSVTYGGVSLTQIDDENQGVARAGVWRLLAPATGTANVVITYAAFQDEMGAVAISLAGVDQTTPEDAPVGTQGASATDPSTIITSAVDDMVLDILMVNHGGAITAGGGQTNRGEVEGIGGSSGVGLSTAPGAASVTMTWTCEWPWAHIAWNVNASVAGGATRQTLMLMGVGS